MTKTFPVEVGQTVYLGVYAGDSLGMPARKMIVGKVAKIGRRYLYIKHNPILKPLRFSKETFVSAPPTVSSYDTNYILFESKHEFQKDSKCREYRKAIASCLSGSFGHTVRTLNISLDALKKIYEILKAEGVASLDPVE